MNAQRPVRRRIYEPLADINVTPLVDVMLVLLIVFMVTAPMLASGMKVSLPEATSSKPLEPKSHIILTVQKDGQLYLGAEPIPIDHVTAAVDHAAGDDHNRAIHLRGNRDVAYGEMVSGTDRLANAGYGKIALIASGTSDPANAH